MTQTINAYVSEDNGGNLHLLIAIDNTPAYMHGYSADRAEQLANDIKAILHEGDDAGTWDGNELEDIRGWIVEQADSELDDDEINEKLWSEYVWDGPNRTTSLILEVAVTIETGEVDRATLDISPRYAGDAANRLINACIGQAA